MERRVPIDEVKEGQVLARPVLAADRSILLDAGAVLNDVQIERLKRWNVRAVVVAEPEAREPLAPAAVESFVTRLEASIEKRLAARPSVSRAPRDVDSPGYRRAEVAEARRRAGPLRARAVRVADEAFDRLRRKDDPEVEPLRSLVQSLVDAGLENRHVFTSVVAVQAYDDHLLDHAVKSTVYAVLTGFFLGFETAELYDLAECTLLHDVGMTRVPERVWRKPGPLDQSEFLEIQKHVVYGADLLADAPGVSPWADIVAYQHHERHDGSGYPKGRAGRGIFEYARIVSLADAYAGMTAPRPYREKMLGYDAMKAVLDSSDRLFHPDVVKAFLAVMALYPLGTLVALSSGDVGLVVAANPRHPYRPTVKVIRAADGTRPAEGDEPILDLKDRPDLVIWEALPTPEGLEAVVAIP